MARVKVLEYTFENETIKVPVNVSVDGTFSCSIQFQMSQKLDLKDNKLSGKTLSDIEDVLNTAFYEYKQRTTKKRMVVSITFKATRGFTFNEKGEQHPAFIGDNSFYESHQWSNEYHDNISFGYRILLEESINGKRFYYSAKKREEVNEYLLLNRLIPESRQLDGWVGESSTSLNPSEKTLIPYSEKLIENLESIKRQLRNAAFFLGDLLSSDSKESLLISDNFKLLK